MATSTGDTPFSFREDSQESAAPSKDRMKEFVDSARYWMGESIEAAKIILLVIAVAALLLLLPIAFGVGLGSNLQPWLGSLTGVVLLVLGAIFVLNEKFPSLSPDAETAKGVRILGIFILLLGGSTLLVTIVSSPTLFGWCRALIGLFVR